MVAIDASTPAATSQTNGATATLVSASFSPPAGSVVVISWQSNSDVSPPASAPTISNTGGLTFSLIGWRSEADLTGSPPGRDGHCAMWYAPVSSAPGSMTCTVTNTATSGSRHARLKPVVLTGVDTASPIASSGEGSDNAGGLSFSYTSAVANSLGFASVSDWDTASSTFTATAGTTIVDSAQVATSVNCATLRQTTATTAGSTVTLGLSSPTSTTWNYVWAEFRPGASATSASAANAAVTAAAQNARGLPGRPMHTELVDNFNDSVVDTSIWTANYGSPTETGGRARIPCTTGYAAYCTSDVWRLAESSVYARLYPPANGGATAEAWIQLLVLTPVAGTDCGAEVNAGVTPTVLNLYSRVGYSDASMVTLTYDSTAHAWVRIRETAGTLYWDTSADGVSWTNRRSLTAPTWVDDGNLQVQLISHRGNGTADFAEVDNVNVNPSITNVVAEVAGFTAAGQDATIAVSGNGAASAANVTAAGQDPTARIDTAAGHAPATASAQDATVTTASAVNAAAEVAGLTVAGADSTVGAVSYTSASAEVAGFGIAGIDATVVTVSTASAAVAAVAAGGLDATVVTVAATNVAAEVAGVVTSGANATGGLAGGAGAATVAAAASAAGVSTSSGVPAGVAPMAVDAPFDPAGGSVGTTLTAENPIDVGVGALNASVSTLAVTFATAGAAGVGVAGQNPAPSASTFAAAGAAAVAVAGQNPAGSVAGSGGAAAVAAAAANAAPATSTAVTAEVAGVAVVGQDADAVTGSFVNAEPAQASVGVAAGDATGTVTASAGAAGLGVDASTAGSAVAASAVSASAGVAGADATVSASTTVTAGAAGVTVAAGDVEATSSSDAGADAATAVAAVGAQPAVVSTSTSASAGVAGWSLVAEDPATTVSGADEAPAQTADAAVGAADATVVQSVSAMAECAAAVVAGTGADIAAAAAVLAEVAQILAAAADAVVGVPAPPIVAAPVSRVTVTSTKSRVVQTGPRPGGVTATAGLGTVRSVP